MATMQQHDGRRIAVAPFKKMEPLLAKDDVAGSVGHVGPMWDTEIAGARKQAAEFVRRRHVQGLGALGKSVEIHAAYPFLQTVARTSWLCPPRRRAGRRTASGMNGHYESLPSSAKGPRFAGRIGLGKFTRQQD